MSSRIALLVLAAAAFAGCAEEGPAGGAHAVVPETASGPNDARERAVTAVVERIAGATCDREQSCNTIGPGATFASREDCMTAVRAKYGKDLSLSMCPGGIDSGPLDDCVKSLDAGQCSQPGDAITRSATCPVKAMCIK